MNAIYLDAGFVKAEVTRLIELYPELADDETLRADVLEGETDINRIVEKALAERQEAEAMAAAIKARESDLSLRRARFERKSDAMKHLIKSVMQAGHLTKMTLPEATLSITKPRTSVTILDVDELPQGYFKTIRQADKAAIKTVLERGENIPGAELALGDEGLTIRAK